MKWEEKTDLARAAAELTQAAARLPFTAGRQVHTALWLKKRSRRTGQITILEPEGVLQALC